MIQPYEGAYPYEYAISAYGDGGGTGTTFVFSNTPLNLVLNDNNNQGNDDTSISEANNQPFVGFNVWYMTYDIWGVYSHSYNPPVYFSSGGLKPLSWDIQFRTGEYYTGIQDISNLTCNA